MSDNVHQFPREEAPSIVGTERTGNAVVVDGYVIPRMHCYDRGDEIEIIIDGRFSYQFPKEWAYLAASMAAQAMAIGEGYSYKGASEKGRPFAPKLVGWKTGESE